MSKTSDLIAELAAGGELASRGEFTLDRERARDKLQRFQLAEPARYVLLLVEAAVAQGATRVQVQIDTDDVRFEFDGTPFDRVALDALWDVLLGDPLPAYPGLRPLALALNAAMGLRPSFVRVHGAGEPGLRLELRAQGAPQLDEAEPASASLVHVRERKGLRSIAEFVRALRSTRDESKFLREHCRYVTTPIFLGKEQVSHGAPEQIGCGSREAFVDGTRLVAGIDPDHWPDHGPKALLERCRRGVRVDVLEVEHWPPGVVALIDGPNFALDLSQAGIRRDDNYNKVIQALDRLVYEMLAEALHEALLVHGLVPGLSHWPASHFRLLYRNALAQAVAHGEVDAHPFAEPLFEVPFFRTLGDARRSVADIRAEIAKRGWVGGAREMPEQGVPEKEEDTLLLPEREDRDLLRAAFAGKLRSRDAVLDRADRRVENKRRWQRMRREARLPEGMWEARVPLARASIVGELGLGASEERVDLIYEGGVIQSFDPQLEIPGLVAVVEGTFMPRKAWDAVHRDQNLARALATILAGIPDALLELDPYRGSVSERAAFIRNFERLLDEDFGEGLFVAAGWSKNGAQKRMRSSTVMSALPRLDPRLPDPHPLVHKPFLRLLSGERVGLSTLAERLEAEGRLTWVSRRFRVPVRYEELPWMLHLDQHELRIVGAVFGEEALHSGQGIVEDAMRVQDFMMRTRELDYDAGPPRALMGALAVSRLELEGAEAWLGVDAALMASYWGPTATGDATPARVNLTHRGRGLCRFNDASELPGVRGYIDLPLEMVDLEKEVPLDAGKALVAQVLAAYARQAIVEGIDLESLTRRGGSLDELQRVQAQQGFMRALWAWGKPDRSEYAREPWRTLAEHMILLAADGAGVSLAELLVLGERLGYLPYTTHPNWAHHWEGPLLRAEKYPADFLEAYTPWKLRNVDRELEQRELSRAIAHRSRVEALELPRPCVAEHEFSIEAKGGRFEGRVGLPAGDPGRRGLELVVYEERRELERMTLPGRPPLVMVLDGDFELQSVEQVLRDDRFESIVDAACARAGALLPALFDALGEPTDPRYELAERWLWALSSAGLLQEIDEDARRRLRSLPLFIHVRDGRAGPSRVSADALVEAFAAWEEIPTLPHLEGGPPEFVRMEPERSELLGGALGLPFRVRSESWSRHRDWLASTPARVARPAALRPPLPVAALPFASADAKGELWIDPTHGPTDACIYLCLSDHIVAEREIHPELQIGGVVHLDPRRHRWLAAPPITPDLDLELMLAGLELAFKAAGLANTEALPPDARRRLARMYRRSAKATDADLVRLREELAEAAIFEHEGEWLDGNAFERARWVEAIAEAEPTPPEPEPEPNDPNAPPEPEPIDPELAAKLQLPPETRLLERVRKELRLARAGAGAAFGDAQLAALRTGHHGGRSPVRVVAQGCSLDLDDPLVRAALEPAAPAAALSLLAASAASALNRWLDEIDAKHELAMCLHLLERAKIR